MARASFICVILVVVLIIMVLFIRRGKQKYQCKQIGGYVDTWCDDYIDPFSKPYLCKDNNIKQRCPRECGDTSGVCERDMQCFDHNYTCEKCCKGDGKSTTGAPCWDAIYTKERCCESFDAPAWDPNAPDVATQDLECAKDPSCFDATYTCTQCCDAGVTAHGLNCWDGYLYTKDKCCNITPGSGYSKLPLQMEGSPPRPLTERTHGFEHTWVRRPENEPNRYSWYNFMTGEYHETCGGQPHLGCSVLDSPSGSQMEQFRNRLVPVGQTPPNFNEKANHSPRNYHHLRGALQTETGVVHIHALNQEHVGLNPGHKERSMQMLQNIKTYIDPICSEFNILVLHLVEFCCCDAFFVPGTELRPGYNVGAFMQPACDGKTALSLHVRLLHPKFSSYDYANKKAGTLVTAPNRHMHKDIAYCIRDALHEMAHALTMKKIEDKIPDKIKIHTDEFLHVERELFKSFGEYWGIRDSTPMKFNVPNNPPQNPPGTMKSQYAHFIHTQSKVS